MKQNELEYKTQHSGKQTKAEGTKTYYAAHRDL